MSHQASHIVQRAQRDEGPIHGTTRRACQPSGKYPNLKYVQMLNIFDNVLLQEMPAPVATLLYGSLGPVYIAEAVSACRETGQSIPLIVDMLAQVKGLF